MLDNLSSDMSSRRYVLPLVLVVRIEAGVPKIDKRKFS